MRKNSPFSIALLLSLFLFVSFILTMPAKSANDNIEITDGTEYWLGLPHCAKAAGEPYRGEAPIMLWVSSKHNTIATVHIPYSDYMKNFPIKPNQITVIPLTDELMNVEPEVIRTYGIQVTSKDPVSVAVYMSYKWSGEAYRCIPTEWLGRKYAALSLYLDKTDVYKPGQILIIASEDNTTVNYIPSAKTTFTDKGEKKQITMMKGQTFLIETFTDPGMVQDWGSDLTGTWIESSKPIAVISGHTKGAFPLYSSTMLGVPANFMRNMMTEMIWPAELVGKEYVTAPIRYSDRVRGKQIDDKGDLIRFVAVENGTEISEIRGDGSGEYKTLRSNLKRGEWFNITNQEKPSIYRSNKPVLVGQYGKTWWMSAVSPIVNGKDDEIQNPPRNGQGMLLVVAPIERWTTDATFRSPPEIDNWVYITFRGEEIDRLKFDGQTFLNKFGFGAVQYIAGTEFAYITEQVAPGDHFIEGLEGATFAGYAYGNWDRSKDGFAYGYPIGINYATPCDDQIEMTDQGECGVFSGKINATPAASECAALFSVRVLSADLYNMDYQIDEFERGITKEVNFKMNVKNMSDSAVATISAMTKSGKIVTKTFTYYPEKVAANPNPLNFGRLTVNETKCLKFMLKNTGTQDAIVSNLRLSSERPDFNINYSDYPITLKPNEEKEIEVCATALAMVNYAIRDTVIADLTCYSNPILPLVYTTGEPIVTMNDLNFNQVPVGKEKELEVTITNIGTAPVELVSYDFADNVHFRTEGLVFPINLEKNNDKYTFKVFYKPTEAGVPNSTRATFVGNTTQTKLYSDWIGEGIDAGPAIVGYDWKERRVIDQYSLNNGIQNYPAKISITNTGTTSDLRVVSVEIPSEFNEIFQFVDKTKIPQVLKPGETVEIDVIFIPKDQEVYETTVKFTAQFDDKIMTAEDYLKGIGIQPHIAIGDKFFEDPLKVGTYEDGVVVISAPLQGEMNTSMDLTIFDEITIEGTNKADFIIDSKFFDDNPYPIVMAPNTILEVPIRFTAAKIGIHEATLVAKQHNAPESPVGLLKGYGFTEGLTPTHHDFGTIYKTLSAEGQVTLLNTGSIPATILEDFTKIQANDPDHKLHFKVLGYRTEKSGIVGDLTKAFEPFDLEPMEKLIVDVRFTAPAVGTYNAFIKYTTSVGEAFSDLVGRGKIHKIQVNIPKDKYKTVPGGKVMCEYMLKQSPDETKPLEEANIKEVKVRVFFKPENRNEIVDAYPNTDWAQSIVTAGTMLEGWEIESTTPVVRNDEELYIKFTNDQPLKGEGVLFKFEMQCYLSDLKLIPLVPEIDPIQPYVEVEEFPGDIKVEAVCVNDLRLVILTGHQYALQQVMPNPVVGKATIEYTTGIIANTLLTVYNTKGEKVATLVDERQNPGKYSVTFNPDELGLSSGVYYYRLENGPFTDTKSMVITK